MASTQTQIGPVVAVMLFCTGIVTAQPLPVSYDLVVDSGSFVFTDMRFSQNGRPHLWCRVQNKTSNHYLNGFVIFTISVKMTNDYVAQFEVPAETVTSYWEKDETLILDKRLDESLYDVQRLVEYKVEFKLVVLPDFRKLDAEYKASPQGIADVKRRQAAKVAEQAAILQRRKAAEDASNQAMTTRIKARLLCLETYRKTIDIRERDLTVRQEQLIQGCRMLGLYHDATL